MKDWAAARARNNETRSRDDEFPFLSFRLTDEFIQGYMLRTPGWGFDMGSGNTLGEWAWYTKYSRVKADGTKERFYEGLRRVIEGMYSIQHDHAISHRLPWSDSKAHRSAEEAYDRAFRGKWSPPGRGFWMMGTEFVNARGDSSALQNCGFLSTKYIATDLAKPFVTLMNMSMLGIGLGFDTLGAGTITLNKPKPYAGFTWKVEDSREGWCKSVERLLLGYFQSGKREQVFDYSDIRPEGSPIKGFGGTSAGPDPLKRLHVMLTGLLANRDGETITSTDIVDIMNMIGKCVVAANVRSSAEIALGSADDKEFLSLKDWRVNPDRMGADGWGYTSNNSVVVKTGDDLSALAEPIAHNGEPGVIWMDVVRTNGRIGDGNTKDHRAMGFNPCAEQPLENHELCTLVETYPTNCDDEADYLRTLKFSYLYGKAVTLLPTQWPETNAVMTRNRRIGTSMTGIAQFVEAKGWAELTNWQENGYSAIRKWDETYSEWLGVRESIRVTTVKPSGTVSLLFGVTPGCHWPTASGYYVRTVRENATSPIVEVMRAAGYKIEPNNVNPLHGVVIYLPVVGPEMRAEREVSVWEKVALAAHCGKHWADNAVSVTATFNAETEADQIGPLLKVFDGQVKSLSFLPNTEGTYHQAPYQMVSREEWQTLYNQVKPLDWDSLYNQGVEPAGELFCTTDNCQVI